MSVVEDQLKLIQKWHWENYVHYERAFIRYLLIGGGAAIGLILIFLKTTTSPYSECISFDTAVWMFTLNILIAGFCVYLNSNYSATNVNNFSKLLGYVEGSKFSSNPSSDKLFEMHEKD